MTMQIAESKTEQARDRIEAMRFLRQLYEDQYSLFMYGPSQFLTRDKEKLEKGQRALSSIGRERLPNEGEEDDSNRVF